MEKEVLQKLIEKCSKVTGLEADKITGDSNLRTELQIKSLEMSAIISEFEEEYDAYIKYTELMHVQTVKEAAEVIAKYCE